MEVCKSVHSPGKAGRQGCGYVGVGRGCSSRDDNPHEVVLRNE